MEEYGSTGIVKLWRHIKACSKGEQGILWKDGEANTGGCGRLVWLVGLSLNPRVIGDKDWRGEKHKKGGDELC